MSINIKLTMTMSIALLKSLIIIISEHVLHVADLCTAHELFTMTTLTEIARLKTQCCNAPGYVQFVRSWDMHDRYEMSCISMVIPPSTHSGMYIQLNLLLYVRHCAQWLILPPSATLAPEPGSYCPCMHESMTHGMRLTCTVA